MKPSPPSSLEDAIRRAGEGWMLDAVPDEAGLDRIRKILAALNQYAQQKLGGDAPRLTEAAVIQEYERSPHQLRAFFQALAGIRSTDMLLAVWQIIQGMRIKCLSVTYEWAQTFSLEIVLEPDFGGEDQIYRSENIYDFELLTHLGIFEVNDRPVFDGFYRASET